MEDKELFFLLALQHAHNVGDVTAKKLLHHCGNAEAIFNEKSGNLVKIERIGRLTIKNVLDKENLYAAEKELEYLREENIKVCAYNEESYPEKLKHCIDGPILLFGKGNMEYSNPRQRILSVVGTRQITSYGNAFCEQFIEDIAPFNPIIVSGFAYGVDICAHKAAIKNELQTIGCLAHGLNQLYPKAHKKYVDQVEQNGGFLTDFWSSDDLDPKNFLRRNRIVAGMSEATVVIESAHKGGSLVTADIAASYHRDVFAVPGRAQDKYSEGCNNLIKSQQAHMLTSAADLVYLLGWELEEAETPTVQKQLFVELEATEQKIYDYLTKKGKELLDVIALDCEMPVHKLTSTLLAMEMKGVIRPLPGKLFEAV
ncbi:DNA-processing protein DprA [Galbibacter sp. EGI 63066]|uniref:DNA-processing protein DprA n=1 Tax=Galbibacter sp. EGI 63066 TaxID=2993559 RepID=UPI0022488EEC|nr:DNA-processing protein DprA [Galbibacter sp. EGI 63066]MCX2681205.1 DNA-processing protein DprA [Galbibacter sp. EGI 63066]